MAQTQTAELAEQLVSDLSGGQQQRVFLAMTLAQDAELVLLDEPTTYLDLNRQAELMGMMRQMQQNGKTVITVLHDLNQACRYCDHLIVMKKGAVMAQGTPDEVMTEELLKDVFDLNVIIHRDPISNSLNIKLYCRVVTILVSSHHIRKYHSHKKLDIKNRALI